MFRVKLFSKLVKTNLSNPAILYATVAGWSFKKYKPLEII
jgi:hypothetical protein